jgi:hypothetical protein
MYVAASGSLRGSSGQFGAKTHSQAQRYKFSVSGAAFQEPNRAARKKSVQGRRAPPCGAVFAIMRVSRRARRRLHPLFTLFLYSSKSHHDEARRYA